MRHPFQAISGGRRFRAVVALLTLALSVRKTMAVPTAQTRMAPHGMLSFALAGDASKARAIIASWDTHVRKRAAVNLGLDPLFSLAWTNAIGLACIWAAEVLGARRWPAAQLGVALAWAQWPAALIATAKDVALLLALQGHAARPAHCVIRLGALLEIAVKGAGLAYAVGGGLAWLTRNGDRLQSVMAASPIGPSENPLPSTDVHRSPRRRLPALTSMLTDLP